MDIDVKEALRYAGVREPDEAALRAIHQAAEQTERHASPRYIYRVFAIVHSETGVSLPDAGLIMPGSLAKTILADCEKAVLLLCTLGTGFDRLLRTAQARHPGLYLTDRFSPGYDDLPLSLQSEFLRALNGEKRLGVCAGPSYLLNPMKSVTAVIGLSDQPQPARIRGCAFCAFKQNCTFRERGMTCGAST